MHLGAKRHKAAEPQPKRKKNVEVRKIRNEKSQTNHELSFSISSPYSRVPEFHIQFLAGPWHSPEEQCK